MSFFNIYNDILLISRNSKIYLEFLEENLNNKILCFLIHISVYFQNSQEDKKKSYQFLFDYIFNRIETDLRELGHGDMSVNKKMKTIITKFYSILVDFKNFHKLENMEKRVTLNKYFDGIKNIDNFSKYLSCFFEKEYKNVDLTLPNDTTPD